MASSSAAARENAPADSVILADRFEIQPQLPLLDLAHAHASAFAAWDSDDPGLPVYALIIEHDLPVREQQLRTLKGTRKPALVQPLGWGPVDWPAAGGRRMAVILTRPAGRRLAEPGQVDLIAIPAKQLLSEFITPFAALLRDLGDMRVTHRNIRPDNLYSDLEKGGGWVLGECFSAPAAYAQSALHETVERAMAMREGRGHGTSADDYYAFGVTLALLAMGGSPLSSLTDDQVIAAKMEQGSYAAIIAGRRPPAELSEILHGLLCDDRDTRWGAQELDNWLLGGRQNPSPPPLESQAGRGFYIGGEEYKTIRTAALALDRNWDLAATLIKDDGLERWVRSCVKDTARADAIVSCRVSAGQNAPRMISDDLLVARTITVLDPNGPLRFRQFSAMPDGFGAALAATTQKPEIARLFLEMISGMLPAFRVGLEQNPKPSLLSLQDLGSMLRRHLNQRGPGYGVERCLYELNPNLQCLSPRVANYLATDIPTLLSAMDAEINNEEPPIDRHIAAFLAARLRDNVDRNLNEIAAASRPADIVLSHLRLLALAQEKVAAPPLPNLCAAFLAQMGPVIDDYGNIPLRKRVSQAAEKAVQQGKLAAFLAIIDNQANRQWDIGNGNRAGARFTKAKAEIKRLISANEHRHLDAEKLGHRWAASLGAIIAATAVAATIYSQMS